MKKVNALKLRQHLGALLEELTREGEPLLIEKSSNPIAVLVPYEQFKRRFVDKLAESDRQALLKKFTAAKFKPVEDSITTLRAIRYGENN